MKNKVDLTNGPVFTTIIKMTIPMMVGMVGMVAFNLVDTFFIAKLGTIELAAISFTLPVIMLQGAISMGLGVGASAVISKAIGMNDSQKVKRLTTDALLLGFLIVVIVIILGLHTIDPLFSMLGAKNETLELVKQYMQIWYLGVPFVVIPMMGNNAIRAAGNTTIPSLIMLTSITINIILDPLLIFGIGPFPRLELEGAALATVIARSVTFVVALLFLKFKFDMLTIRFEGIKETLNSWKEVLYIGIPAALTQLLIPLSTGFITRLVALNGTAAIAAYGVSSRIERFVLSPIIALGAVVTPFTGQNYGAGKWDRIRSGIKASAVLSLATGFIMWLVFLLYGAEIGKVFNETAEVYEKVALYLTIVGLTYGCHGLSLIIASVFSALQKPFSAVSLNIIKLFFMLIPLSYAGSVYFNLTGIFGGIASSYIISGIFAWIYLQKVLAKIIKSD
ncbi:MAG: MATE family efflux transporter [Candidatus Rifleibacteriota bacterium]